MCLGIPGKILSIAEQDGAAVRMGRVSFSGIVKEVCLAYTPEAAVGEYVVVHVGFAIATLDEAEARRVFEYLQEMDELRELADAEQTGGAP
jgi:hydrogenase expression/formation protein HypC